MLNLSKHFYMVIFLLFEDDEIIVAHVKSTSKRSDYYFVGRTVKAKSK